MPSEKQEPVDERTWVIRGMPDGMRHRIKQYAAFREVTMAEAIRELISIALFVRQEDVARYVKRTRERVARGDLAPNFGSFLSLVQRLEEAEQGTQHTSAREAEGQGRSEE